MRQLLQACLEYLIKELIRHREDKSLLGVAKMEAEASSTAGELVIPFHKKYAQRSQDLFFDYRYKQLQQSSGLRLGLGAALALQQQQ